MIVFMKVLNSW